MSMIRPRSDEVYGICRGLQSGIRLESIVRMPNNNTSVRRVPLIECTHGRLMTVPMETSKLPN